MTTTTLILHEAHQRALYLIGYGVITQGALKRHGVALAGLLDLAGAGYLTRELAFSGYDDDGDRVNVTEWRLRDNWVPAGGGTETEYVENGKRKLRVWNPLKGIHGTLDLGTDIVEPDKSPWKD